MNNEVLISGEIVTEPIVTHEVFGEKFMECNVSVPRLSGVPDILPVMFSNRSLANMEFHVGDTLSATGQFRSYNKIIDGKSTLCLKVFVNEFGEVEKPNFIALTGYLCKPVSYRTTPNGREIADLLIAVNRAYNKSDYIPCIIWGRNARFSEMLPVGTKVSIYGRIQSREYQKRISDTEAITKVAYEVSINNLSIEDDSEAQ